MQPHDLSCVLAPEVEKAYISVGLAFIWRVPAKGRKDVRL